MATMSRSTMSVLIAEGRSSEADGDADWRTAEETLVQLAGSADPARARLEANEVLCRLLEELGYGAVVRAWRRVQDSRPMIGQPARPMLRHVA